VLSVHATDRYLHDCGQKAHVWVTTEVFIAYQTTGNLDGCRQEGSKCYWIKKQIEYYRIYHPAFFNGSQLFKMYVVPSFKGMFPHHIGQPYWVSL